MKRYVPKILYLPSGGLSYTSIAHVHKLDTAYYFHELADDSENYFDNMLSVVSHYCDLPAPVHSIYTCDIHYIYTYIVTTDLIRDTYLPHWHICHSCGNATKLQVSVAEMAVRFRNPYVPRPSRFFLDRHNTQIELGMRTVLDNMRFSVALQQLEEEFSSAPFTEVVIRFLLPQIRAILQNEKPVPEDEWSTILRSMVSRDLFVLIDTAYALNKSYGLYDRIKYHCSECQTSNSLWLYDDMLDGRPRMGTPSDPNAIEKTVKGILSESKLPCLTVNEILERPLSLQDAYVSALGSMDFRVGQVIL